MVILVNKITSYVTKNDHQGEDSVDKCSYENLINNCIHSHQGLGGS